MKFLVARGLARVQERVPSHAFRSKQVFEKLYEFVGITNVIDVTAKSGTKAARSGVQKGWEDEKIPKLAPSDYLRFSDS